jgi:hypothetical protein
MTPMGVIFRSAFTGSPRFATNVPCARRRKECRKGQRCVVLARGTMNSCLVRFEETAT